MRRPRRGVGTCVEATFRRWSFSKHFSPFACLSFFRLKFSGIAMRVSVVGPSSCRGPSSVDASIDCVLSFQKQCSAEYLQEELG